MTQLSYVVRRSIGDNPQAMRLVSELELLFRTQEVQVGALQRLLLPFARVARGMEGGDESLLCQVRIEGPCAFPDALTVGAFRKARTAIHDLTLGAQAADIPGAFQHPCFRCSDCGENHYLDGGSCPD